MMSASVAVSLACVRSCPTAQVARVRDAAGEKGEGTHHAIAACLRGLLGHRTFCIKPGNIPGKVGLSWSPRGRTREQRGAGTGIRRVALEAAGFILHLIGMETMAHV